VRGGVSVQTSRRRLSEGRLSRPQLVLPGQVIFADRVSLEHRFLLRPDRQMCALFFYFLGVYARAHGIQVHAVVLMSTHYHLLFTDVRGVRGEFFRDFHAMLAKAVQGYRGVKSVVFDKRPTSQVDCVTPKACVEAMAYLVCNPVDAGIVADPTQWPGLFTRVEDAGQRRVARFGAPRSLRREDGTYVPFVGECWPDFVDLVQEPLCEAVDMDPDACVAEVRRYVEARIAEKRATQATKGSRFVGVLHAMHQRVTKHAASWYTPPCLERKIAPRVKAGTGEGVARTRALRRLLAFWEAHADARRRLLAGELDVVFPAGTFRWHRLFGFPREEVEAALFERAAFS
jgi:putative transposase